MDRESGRAYIDDEAEIVKARDEALGERAKVAIVGTVVKDGVGGGAHRGGHGQDRFLGSAAALDPQELSAEVAVFLPSGGPGGLDQRGLEPRVARAGFIAADAH